MRNINVFIDKEYEKINEPLCKSIIEKENSLAYLGEVGEST